MSYKAKTKEKATLTRRQALAICGTGVAAPFLMNPMQVLLRGIVDGIISSAEASTASTPPRTLINYHMTDGPAAWCAMLPMSPYANGAPNRGTHVNTGFEGGVATYKTHACTLKDNSVLHMPSLWASNIATQKGVTPMTALIDNMLIMRGIQGNSNDSHSAGRREMTRPLGNRPSLLGLVADASGAPIQSILTNPSSDGTNLAFKAAHSGQTRVTSFSSPIKEILQPFDRSADALNSTFVTRRALKDTLIQSALASLGNYAASNAPGSEALFAMRNSAELILKTGVSAATGAYSATLTKYKKLISDCASLSTLKMVGITDREVPLPTATAKGVMQASISGLNGSFAQNSDLATVIAAGTYPKAMAENFAIAEILVTQKLSQSIGLVSGFGGVYGLNYVNPATFTNFAPASPGGWWNADEHFGGSYLSLIINSFMYQCLYSCMNELINVLKTNGLFDETVIFITGDFGRSQSAVDPGTDHASDACSMQVFSGAIAKSSVIGNISRGAAVDYGQFRNVANVFGAARPLNIYDATSTIAGLARVTPPSDNNPPLVSPNGTPLVELAKETA